jgi:hypothetical protein
MKDKIKELEQKIQEEIWRIQMIDYPTPNTFITSNGWVYM